MSIDLRSTQFCGGLGVTLPSNVDAGVKNEVDVAELPYVKMLNRVLPQDIRILDWSPAPQGFSARFDCQSRTYRYYFPRGALDVTLMAEAAKRWVVPNDPACNLKTGQINNEPYCLVYPRFFLGLQSLGLLNNICY